MLHSISSWLLSDISTIGFNVLIFASMIILSNNVYGRDWSVIFHSYNVFARFLYQDFADTLKQIGSYFLFILFSLKAFAKDWYYFMLKCLETLTHPSSGLEPLFMRFWITNKFCFLNSYRHTLPLPPPVFYCMSFCVLQGICLFRLNCQFYWHEIIHSIYN